MIRKFTVGVTVNNHYGVLNRVTALFSKRGYNIDSLAVGETENPALSRITIVCTGDDYMREQVVRQLEKLEDVKRVTQFCDADAVSAEHLLIKLKVNGEGNSAINALINRYGGKVRDFGSDFITAEITAPSEEIDAFIETARSFGILETCRSGAIALSKGSYVG
ncbi:MAG: acetolactate synthase small subunit [Oscillospiraceae bacterium]|jgi:acetolactate synthase-1/3 small subunit|nr:acetolactate synthase small subunit [Oscillospiraceae bacterium]